MDPKIPEEEEGRDSLDPKSSEVNEEEAPFCLFPSILPKKQNFCIKITTLNQKECVGVLLYRDNPTKLHQPPPEKGLKMRKKNTFISGN